MTAAIFFKIVILRIVFGALIASVPLAIGIAYKEKQIAWTSFAIVIISYLLLIYWLAVPIAIIYTVYIANKKG